MPAPKRFRCPACHKVVERENHHGNTKTIESFCESKGKDVLLKRIVYRRAK